MPENEIPPVLRGDIYFTIIDCETGGASPSPMVEHVNPLVGVGAHDDPRIIKCCKIIIDCQTGGHKPLPYGGLWDFIVKPPIVPLTQPVVFI